MIAPARCLSRQGCRPRVSVMRAPTRSLPPRMPGRPPQGPCGSASEDAPYGLREVRPAGAGCGGACPQAVLPAGPAREDTRRCTHPSSRSGYGLPGGYPCERRSRGYSSRVALIGRECSGSRGRGLTSRRGSQAVLEPPQEREMATRLQARWIGRDGPGPLRRTSARRPARMRRERSPRGESPPRLFRRDRRPCETVRATGRAVQVSVF